MKKKKTTNRSFLDNCGEECGGDVLLVVGSFFRMMDSMNITERNVIDQNKTLLLATSVQRQEKALRSLFLFFRGLGVVCCLDGWMELKDSSRM